MYKAEQEAQPQGGAPAGNAGEPTNKKDGDNVEDVDFEEVKE